MLTSSCPGTRHQDQWRLVPLCNHTISCFHWNSNRDTIRTLGHDVPSGISSMYHLLCLIFTKIKLKLFSNSEKKSLPVGDSIFFLCPTLVTYNISSFFCVTTDKQKILCNFHCLLLLQKGYITTRWYKTANLVSCITH